MKAAAAVDGIRKGVLALQECKVKAKNVAPKLECLFANAEEEIKKKQLGDCLANKIKEGEGREIGCGCTKCRVNAAKKAADGDKSSDSGSDNDKKPGCPKCAAAAAAKVK